MMSTKYMRQEYVKNKNNIKKYMRLEYFKNKNNIKYIKTQNNNKIILKKISSRPFPLLKLHLFPPYKQAVLK